MDRPKGFADNRFLGDKRTRSSTTSTTTPRPRAIEDLMADRVLRAFGPDTLAEARNRGYKLWKGSRTPS